MSTTAAVYYWAALFPHFYKLLQDLGEIVEQLIKKQLMTVPQGQFASQSLKCAGY